MAMSASTSYAAHSTNNSCYDVFISHRGPDVKKTFASHLYRRLISYGLRIFLDYQELQEGEDLTSQITGAISTASIHVAILSPTYADSQWCLDELVLMLESKAPIIPVFHHVTPAEVRRTRGEGVYARSLDKLERKTAHDSEPRYSSKTVENWRNALTRVANISGLDLEAFDGDEGELLDQLVEVLLKKGVKTHLNVARYPTGLEEKMKDFETKVLRQQQRGRVQVCGITGLGGVGKTTLAKELFNRESSNYSKSYFLFDIRENAKNSLHSLQSQLLKGLLKFDMHIDNRDQGIEILRKHLSDSQVLLVLDDVDDVDQVQALLPVDVLRHGSLILITSRDKNILQRSGVQESSIYKLTGLNRERSRELFCSHVFCQPHPLPGFEDLVEKFLEACNGLPLSLKVFGGLLYGNDDISYWEDELDALEKTLPGEIQKKLLISYDALQPEEQQIFLDIACFFIGESKDTAIRVWNGSGWNGSRGFRSLLNKCLVEVEISVFDYDGERNENIRMHDHLRDMGRDLAKGSGLPCRLWCGTKHIDDIWPESSEATKVRGIRMLSRYASSDDDDERAYFSRYKMKNLQLLDIDEIEDDLLKCLLERVDSPKLLWFRWLHCPCSSLPPYIPTSKLRVLEVEGSELKTLWQEEFQVPLHLEHLRLGIPSVSSLPDSFGNLSRLEHIDLSNCRALERLSDSFGNLIKLKYLDLNSCFNLSSLPDSFGNLSALEHIGLSGCSGLETLPDSFGDLIKLKYLDLNHCSNLSSLPDSFGNLSALEHIGLSHCSGLETLPDSFRDLIKLKYLDLNHCCNLSSLPDSFENLSALEHIGLSHCSGLETLPDSFGDLIKLKYLDVNHCCNLSSLPDSFGNLSTLEHVDLSFCRDLERLPDSFGDLIKLKYLDLNHCCNLSSLPDSFGNLSTLEHVNLSFCLHWEKLPDSVGDLIKLKYLDLSQCWNLSSLPDSFGDLIKLKYLDASQCWNLSSLPDSFGNLSTLEVVNLSFCKHLERLPDSFGDLIKLKYLDLSVCLNLSSLPDSIGNLSTLEHVNLSSCSHLERLPDSFGDLINLKYLNLYGCWNLSSLPDSFRNLPKELLESPGIVNWKKVDYSVLRALGMLRDR